MLETNRARPFNLISVDQKEIDSSTFGYECESEIQLDVEVLMARLGKHSVMNQIGSAILNDPPTGRAFR